MWVKVCANTTLEDALLAAQLGADAVGFVFAPSVRQVSPEQVAQITPHLPSRIERVGVFPACSADRIAAAVAQARLTAVQLHAAFDANLARALRQALPSAITIIQAVHWQVEPGRRAEVSVRQIILEIEDSGLVDRILVDSRIGNATGGTGKPFDWTAAEAVFHTHPKLILAGGLRPRNVGQAMNRLRPWGVDVASGVEAEAGRKDPVKMKAFIQEAKGGAAQAP